MHRVFAVALQACEIICAKTSLGHKTFRLVETVAYKGFGWCGYQPIKKNKKMIAQHQAFSATIWTFGKEFAICNHVV